MGEAKSIRVATVRREDAEDAIRRWHYSGCVVQNSQIHMGVFMGGKLLGAMQFGPSLDKRKIQPLVAGTGWNEFIELNRMAFSDALPRNSESRAIAVAMRMIRKNAPHIRWVVSFSDGAQCGDGTIYRASGFVLTGIRQNNSVWIAPNGETFSRTSLTAGGTVNRLRDASRAAGIPMASIDGRSMRPFIEAGFRPMDGFQLRYIYFIDPASRDRLTVPVIPFNAIDVHGAGMYRGKKVSRAERADSCPSSYQDEGDGANPISALHSGAS